MKTGYDVVEIGRNTVGLPYHPFLNWSEKFGNFQILALFIYLPCTVHLG
jgi:hypothetical protein